MQRVATKGPCASKALQPPFAPRLPGRTHAPTNPPLQASDQSWPSIVFCIGGPFGHAPAVRQRGNDTIRLSKMVLNHQVGNSTGISGCYILGDAVVGTLPALACEACS